MLLGNNYVAFFCQIIEGLFHLTAHKFYVVDTMYSMDHYTAGVILFGDKTALLRHSLPKVMCVASVLMVWGVVGNGKCTVGSQSKQYITK